MKKIAPALIIVALAVSCKDQTMDAPSEFACYFAAPQPADDSEIFHIPAKYRGDYRYNDTDVLHVEKDLIWSEWFDRNEIPLKQFDSLRKQGEYRNGILVVDRTRFSVTIKDTTALLSYHMADTSLVLGPDAKAKRIRGSLVISRKDSVFWNMRLLQISHDTLYIRGLYNRDDLALARGIVKDITINADTTVVRMNPTRQEFLTLLKNSGKLSGQSYRRMKE